MRERQNVRDNVEETVWTLVGKMGMDLYPWTSEQIQWQLWLAISFYLVR